MFTFSSRYSPLIELLAPSGLRREIGATDVGLVVVVAEIGGLLVEQLAAQGELLVQEPRLDERDAELGALGTRAQVHRETLAATGEVPRVEQVEVRSAPA